MKKALSGLQDMLTLLDEPNDFNGRLKELWEFCAHELKDGEVISFMRANFYNEQKKPQY